MIAIHRCGISVQNCSNTAASILIGQIGKKSQVVLSVIQHAIVDRATLREEVKTSLDPRGVNRRVNPDNPVSAVNYSESV